MRYGTHTLATLSLFSVSALAAVSAQAQVTVTLDMPNQTVAVPASGSIFVNFTGTVKIDKGYANSGGYIDFPFNASSSNDLITSFSTLDISKANDGGSVSGLLFTAEVPSTTPTGYYGYHFGTLDPSIYQVSVTPIGGTTVSNGNAKFSVTVAPASTPEPGSVALLIGLGVSGTGFLVRRRRNSR